MLINLMEQAAASILDPKLTFHGKVVEILAGLTQAEHGVPQDDTLLYTKVHPGYNSLNYMHYEKVSNTS